MAPKNLLEWITGISLDSPKRLQAPRAPKDPPTEISEPTAVIENSKPSKPLACPPTKIRPNSNTNRITVRINISRTVMKPDCSIHTPLSSNLSGMPPRKREKKVRFLLPQPLENAVSGEESESIFDEKRGGLIVAPGDSESIQTKHHVQPGYKYRRDSQPSSISSQTQQQQKTGCEQNRDQTSSKDTPNKDTMAPKVVHERKVVEKQIFLSDLFMPSKKDKKEKKGEKSGSVDKQTRKQNTPEESNAGQPSSSQQVQIRRRTISLPIPIEDVHDIEIGPSPEDPTKLQISVIPLGGSSQNSNRPSQNSNRPPQNSNNNRPSQNSNQPSQNNNSNRSPQNGNTNRPLQNGNRPPQNSNRSLQNSNSQQNSSSQQTKTPPNKSQQASSSRSQNNNNNNVKDTKPQTNSQQTKCGQPKDNNRQTKCGQPKDNNRQTKCTNNCENNQPKGTQHNCETNRTKFTHHNCETHPVKCSQTQSSHHQRNSSQSQEIVLRSRNLELQRGPQPQIEMAPESTAKLGAYLPLNRNGQDPNRVLSKLHSEVVLREDVLEIAQDPHPNAFFDDGNAMLRVYHGPAYGNPNGISMSSRRNSMPTQDMRSVRAGLMPPVNERSEASMSNFGRNSLNVPNPRDSLRGTTHPQFDHENRCCGHGGGHGQNHQTSDGNHKHDSCDSCHNNTIGSDHCHNCGQGSARGRSSSHEGHTCNMRTSNNSSGGLSGNGSGESRYENNTSYGMYNGMNRVPGAWIEDDGRKGENQARHNNNFGRATSARNNYPSNNTTDNRWASSSSNNNDRSGQNYGVWDNTGANGGNDQNNSNTVFTHGRSRSRNRSRGRVTMMGNETERSANSWDGPGVGPGGSSINGVPGNRTTADWGQPVARAPWANPDAAASWAGNDNGAAGYYPPGFQRPSAGW